MNRVETAANNQVKHHPILKLKIRNVHRRLLDRPAPSMAEWNHEITAQDGFFLGFYDNRPFSSDGFRLLANRWAIQRRMPSVDDGLEVGHFEGEGYPTLPQIGTAEAWNWRTGFMLLWRGSHGRVFFNNHREGSDVARVVNMEMLEATWLPAPRLPVGCQLLFRRGRTVYPRIRLPGGSRRSRNGGLPKGQGYSSGSGLASEGPRRL